MRRLLLLLLAAALLALPTAAQEAILQPTNAPHFAPLADWPAPSTLRTGSGRPGPDYWQQRADYRIAVTLDPATNRVSAEQRITYHNNSPEPLDELWVHVEQNLFGERSRGAKLTPADSRWRGSFPEGGYTFERVEVVRDGRRTGAEYLVDDTRMRIALREPLAPGAQVALDLAWSYTIPEYGADRMGRLAVEGGNVFQLAQWFPRMVVYDDVRGWNALPYLGQGEFYLNYGDYDVEITVPAGYVVVATGSHTNPEQTWTAEERARLTRARQSAESVHVVTPSEAGRRPTGGGTTTWRFRAENVRDFAWAASDRFIVDAAGYRTPAGNDVLIMSAYPPEGVSDDPSEPGWEEATRFSRHSIKYHSEKWLPDPYPVAISVAGVVGGMEYPMIQFSGVDRRHMALYGVIDHELGHQWFPMIVGSDERRHFWLDEGLNTFITIYSGRNFYNENPDPTIAGYGEGEALRVVALTRPDATVAFMQDPVHGDLPIMTTADHVRRDALGFVAYRKPGVGIYLLREQILGPERFDRAFKAYIDRWAYKHPQPADFFRTIESVAGEDLAWFWRGWFYTTETLDQAVTGIRHADGRSIVTVEQSGLYFPVDLAVTFADGATERYRVPVEAFVNGDRFDFAVPDARRAVAAEADPDRVFPDVDRSNNAYRVGVGG
jgi:hypothetical protein